MPIYAGYLTACPCMVLRHVCMQMPHMPPGPTNALQAVPAIIPAKKRRRHLDSLRPATCKNLSATALMPQKMPCMSQQTWTCRSGADTADNAPPPPHAQVYYTNGPPRTPKTEELTLHFNTIRSKSNSEIDMYILYTYLYIYIYTVYIYIYVCIFLHIFIYTYTHMYSVYILHEIHPASLHGCPTCTNMRFCAHGPRCHAGENTSLPAVGRARALPDCPMYIYKPKAGAASAVEDVLQYIRSIGLLICWCCWWFCNCCFCICCFCS